MNFTKTMAVLAVCAALSACTQTATEKDFGNSVRSMISAQTLNPEPQAGNPESGDGQRLEGVLEDYRGTVTKRTSVSSDTQLGVQ